VTNREKIMIAMAGAALLYGIYATISTPKIKDVPASITAPETIPMAEEALIENNTEKKAITRVLANAKLSWKDKVFLSTEFIPEAKAHQGKQFNLPSEINKISYSGYLDMDGKRIAILNNSEYRTNDTIDGFTITEISPDKIHLSRNGHQYNIAIQETK